MDTEIDTDADIEDLEIKLKELGPLKLKVSELRILAKKFGIDSKGNKADLIERILKRIKVI